MATKITPEMTALEKRLIDERKVAESTAKAYINSLYTLNDKRGFKTLSFLRDTETVMKRLEPYAKSTKSAMLGAIVSALKLYADAKAYKKAYAFYEKTAQDIQKERREEEDSGAKSEKQKENWIEWKEVLKLKDGLQEKAEAVKGKVINQADYDALLHNMVLALYTELKPRRNQDYLLMDIILADNFNDMVAMVNALPTNRNYLLCFKDLMPYCFVFNVYKTAKTYGREFITAPDGEFRASFRTYIKYHPTIVNKKPKDRPAQFPFLVDAKGNGLSVVNSITRILNKVFGKKVGSSMLRHIYLSDKYDLNEMEKDAREMAHSTAQQRQYLKRSEETAPSAPPTEAT